MKHTEINDAHQAYFNEYGTYPDELFINKETKEELIRTPFLDIDFGSASSDGKRFSTVFNKPIYVTNIKESFMWVGAADLEKARAKELEEGWDARAVPVHVPYLRNFKNGKLTVTRNETWKEIHIPREIIEFEYPKD